MKKINPLGGLDSILSGLGSLLIVAGIILLILRFVNEPNYWFFYNNSLVILLIGTFLLGISLIYSRIENIENKLEIEEKNQIRNLSFTNEQIYSDFLRQIRDKSFITKLSIFIPYQNEISRKFLQELIENRNFDSKVKILLGVDRNQHEDIVFKHLMCPFIQILAKLSLHSSIDYGQLPKRLNYIKMRILLFLLILIWGKIVFASNNSLPCKLEIDNKNAIKSNPSPYWIVQLPFKHSKNLEFNSKSIDPKNYYVFGFSINGKGVCLINKLKDGLNIITFKNVKTTNSTTNNLPNELVYEFPLLNEAEYPYKTENSILIKFDSVVIKSQNIINSNPEFSLIESGKKEYLLNLKNKKDSFLFTILKVQKSDLAAFIIFLILGICGGILSSLNRIQGTKQAWIAIVVFVIAFIAVFCLFYYSNLPANFFYNFWSALGLGSILGLIIGAFFYSLYILIRKLMLDNLHSAGVIEIKKPEEI